MLGWASPEILVGRHRRGRPALALRPPSRCARPDPILRLRLLRDPLLRSTNIVFALTTAVFLGSLYLTPIFLQQVMGQSPIESGTTTFVEVLGVGGRRRRPSAGSTRGSARGSCARSAASP